MRKKYNTPHRRHVVKTRMTDEEYADFTGRLAAYEISQSEFIRQAIRKATMPDMFLILFVFGHGKSPFLNNGRGRQHLVLSPS